MSLSVISLVILGFLCQLSLQQSINTAYTECQSNLRRCFTIPAKCTKDCTVLMTAKPGMGSVDFELYWKIPNGMDWVGTGLLTANKMSTDTAMVYAIITNNQITVKEGITTDTKMTVKDASSVPIIKIMGTSVDNNMAAMKWNRMDDTTIDTKKFNMMNKYYVLLAFGKTMGGKINDPGKNMIISESSVSLGQPLAVLTTSRIITTLTTKRSSGSVSTKPTTKHTGSTSKGHKGSTVAPPVSGRTPSKSPQTKSTPSKSPPTKSHVTTPKPTRGSSSKAMIGFTAIIISIILSIIM